VALEKYIAVFVVIMIIFDNKEIANYGSEVSSSRGPTPVSLQVSRGQNEEAAQLDLRKCNGGTPVSRITLFTTIFRCTGDIDTLILLLAIAHSTIFFCVTLKVSISPVQRKTVVKRVILDTGVPPLPKIHTRLLYDTNEKVRRGVIAPTYICNIAIAF
jgi:hypothetical protein